MEKVFFVQDADLKEVNMALQKGGKVKMIHAVAVDKSDNIRGTGYAKGYIVVDMPNNKPKS